MLKLNWHVKTEECDKGYVTEPVFSNNSKSVMRKISKFSWLNEVTKGFND